ncbi:circularly permuted type 2 ATP-grasp protein [Ottowia sp.]|uniref:circularly permuted type 2 ATP-grasp protein n=1 Tax=Ottowia sp. TaxID=1898956 RepID=UPI003A8BF0E4
MNALSSPSNPFSFAEQGHFDELLGTPHDDSVNWSDRTRFAPVWQDFASYLSADPGAELDRRAARLRRQLREHGVTYNVRADDANLQRPWPLDLFPLLITPGDWQRIEAGVLQRVRVLDAIMRDMYGERRLLKDGLLPAALVQGHPEYLRAMHGMPALGGMHLHTVAFDLARGPQGFWWVVTQRTQAPSGLGYLLENRLSVSGQFPNAFQGMRVRRLADTYRRFINAIKRMAPHSDGDAHIALLTPGPYNETYFEHAYLARYLGVTLAEGSDLTVRNQRLFLKTLRGLQPVHGLIKRMDDAFLDPLEMRPESRLGVPGLMQAVRAGNVLVANTPGAGFLESSALLGFLPALAQHLLDEELSLPALHTWWCGEPAAMRDVLPQLGRCVIKPTYPWSTSRGTFNVGVGPLMSTETLDSWRASIQRTPEEHTVQAYLPPSQMPTWVDHESGGRIQPRAAILRVFALCDGPGSWRVLPGGMTRLVGGSAGMATMASGGSSTDTWVLGELRPPDAAEADQGAGLAAITPESTTLVLRERLITSRAAESLYWLGRYTERAENSCRLAEIILETLHGDEDPSPAVLMWLGQMAEAAGLVPEDGTSPLQDQAEFERLLLDHLGDTGSDTPGMGHALSALRQSATAVRERMSTEHWNAVKDAEESFLSESQSLRGAGLGAGADAQLVLAQLSRTLSAVTGLQQDRMWRDDGWRMLTVGRLIERLIWLSEALSKGFYTNAVHDAAGYAVVLDLFDSTISFHARHQRSRGIAALIAHLALNRQNPRSIGGVIHDLQTQLAQLDANEPEDLQTLAPRLQVPEGTALPRLCTHDGIGDFIHLQAWLQGQIEIGVGLSDDIGLRHFSHTGDERRSLGA